MDAREVKAKLKEAKSLLKQEDGDGALKISRAILRQDEKNYSALITEGYALQILKKPAQSLESYKKAAKIDPHGIVAWKGIIDHYERNKFTFATKDDVLEAYKRITVSLEKDKDTTQYVENTLKYAGVLQSQGDLLQSVKVLGKLVKSRGNSPQIAKAAVGVLSQMKTIEKPEEELYLSCLAVLHGSNQATDKNLEKYFQLLYKNERYDELKNVCFALSDRFNTFYQPMEYICRLYLENRLSQVEENSADVDASIILVVEKLFKLYPSSQMGYFAQGKIYFQANKYSDAIGWLKEGIESKFNEFAAQLLITAQLRIWDFIGAEEYCLLALKSILRTPINFRFFLCQALLGQERFVEVENMLAENNLNITQSTIDAIRAEMLAVQGKWDELDALLSNAGDEKDWDWKLNMFKKWNNPDELVSFCESSGSANFPLALKCTAQLFKLEDHASCITTLSMCLNLCPSHPMVQFYIAKLHILEGNSEGAKPYLVRAYQSLPTPEIGTCLSDLYFELQDHEANKLLLLEATKKGKKAATKWAWLRLGILNLTLGEANDAVVALHSALMTDHLDSTIWETLADAYFSRGSYETSLRAYNKCLELGAHPTYPKFRIGVVHQHLGEEEMAVTILSELGDYSPSLVELSKAWLQIAKKRFTEGLDASVQQAIFECMKAAGRAILAATTQAILPLKVIAECVMIAGGLNKNVSLKIPAYFINENGDLEETVNVNLEEFLQVGLRAVSSGMQSTTSKSLLSNFECDTAKLCLQLYLKCGSKPSHRQLALHHAKKAILLHPTSHVNWNVLGVFAAVTGNGKLAQHSFIKSINLNATGNTTAWCNLGFLYITKGEFYQAHRCFNQGQSCEPSYGYSWIGQALAAEVLAPKEAIDLYRHACVLEDTHTFASLGYADWVCKTLEAERTSDYVYNIENLEAVSTSLEKLWLYNARSPTASSFNLQGILQSHEYLLGSAEESFQKALELVPEGANSEGLRESIKLNLIYALLERKDFKRVLELVASLGKPMFRSTAAAAVAFEKSSESLQAFNTYEVLKALAKTDAEMCGVLIAQGLVAYKVYGIEEAKTLLFRGCQSTITIPEGYFALGALSLMNNEQDLTQAIINELVKKCSNSQKNLHDIAVMHSFFLVSQGQATPALRSILKRIHNHPYNGKLRSVLSSHLINFLSEGTSARSSLLSASYLGEKTDHAGIALTYLLEGDTTNALKSARKAVQINRRSGTSWAVLVSSLFARYSLTGAQTDFARSLSYAKMALANIEWEENDAIRDWLQTFIDSPAELGV